jgi:hypothetical protein
MESRDAVGVIRFRYDVPLDQTMEFESVYHPGLQLDLEQKHPARFLCGCMWTES